METNKLALSLVLFSVSFEDSKRVRDDRFFTNHRNLRWDLIIFSICALNW